MTSKSTAIPGVKESIPSFRRLRFHRLLLCLWIFLVVPCVWVLASIIADYETMKAKMPLLAQLKKENESKEKQYGYLLERVKRMSQKVVELQALDQDVKVKVNSEQGGFHLQQQGIGGSKKSIRPLAYSRVIDEKDLVPRIDQSLDHLHSEMIACKAKKIRLYEFFRSQKAFFSAVPSIRPTKGWLSSRFGYRMSPFTGEREFHDGIDISARLNAPIVAPADGFASSIRRDKNSGNVLCLNHGYGIETVYGHLQKVLVRKGQYVKRGKTMALVGNTGRSTGPHLHYEVRLHGIPVNPLNYIAEEGQSAQSASSNSKRMKEKKLRRVFTPDRGNSHSGVIRLFAYRTSSTGRKGASGDPSDTVLEKAPLPTHREARFEITMHSHHQGSTSSGQTCLYPYSLKLDSFRDLRRTERAASKYAAKGLPTYWTKVHLGKKGTWYRILAGHFRDRDEAERFRRKLAVSGSKVVRIKYANLIGTYSKGDEVEKKVSSLSKLDYSPYMIEDSEGNFRLFVGAFFTEAGANRQYHELQSDGIQNKVVMR